MTIPLVTFALGGILILVSVLGGGFEVRELKIPKVNWITRLMAAVAGMLFIVVAIGIDQKVSRPEDSTTSLIKDEQVPPPAPPKRINFVVTDELGENQVLEATTVYINGSHIGDFSLNPQLPRASLAGWASSAGAYNYHLQTLLQVNREDGQARLQCRGEGIVHLVEGARYAVRLLKVQNDECLEDLVAIQ